MFKLNHPTKTISGEVLKPFLVENKTVYCFDSAGRTINKTLDDFDFSRSANEETLISASSIKTVAPVATIARPQTETVPVEEVIERPPEIERVIVAEEDPTIVPTIREVTVEPIIYPTDGLPSSTTVSETEEKISYDRISPYDGLEEIQVGGYRPAAKEEVVVEVQEDTIKPGDAIDDEDYI